MLVVPWLGPEATLTPVSAEPVMTLERSIGTAVLKAVVADFAPATGATGVMETE